MWPTDTLTESLNLKWPILQAPMGSASTPALAAAVTNAGGLGGLGMWGRSADHRNHHAKGIAGLRDSERQRHNPADILPAEFRLRDQGQERRCVPYAGSDRDYAYRQQRKTGSTRHKERRRATDSHQIAGAGKELSLRQPIILPTRIRPNIAAVVAPPIVRLAFCAPSADTSSGTDTPTLRFERIDPVPYPRQGSGISGFAQHHTIE